MIAFIIPATILDKRQSQVSQKEFPSINQ